jgi:D-amino-acid dehydrogenase
MYVLRDLIRSSMILYEGLASRIDFGYENNGSLALFATKRGFENGRRDADALSELGIDSRVLDASGLAEADPLFSPRLEGAVRYPQDAQLSPVDFGTKMAKLASGLGVRIKTGVEVIGFRFSDRAVDTVRTTAGEFRPAAVVIAAGAWSSLLARQLGLALPVQAGKGYSLSVDSSEFRPKTPLLLGETKVAITPMGRSVRLTGRFELSGLDTSVNTGRVQSILHSAAPYFRNPLPAVGNELWSGLRPCTPDGLPVISRYSKLPNVVVAAGHGMLGVTLGPITGKMVSDLICETPLGIHGSELSIERFE